MALTLKKSAKLSPITDITFEAPSPRKVPPVKAPSGTLKEILGNIYKDKGVKVVVTGDKIPVPRRLPTGIFEFDFYTGGGFPCGRYSIVYGPESGGKTNLALKAVVSAQKLPSPCNKVIWANIEQTFDPVWAERLGVNTKELLVIQAGYGEEAIDLVDALVRAEDVALIVVDSLAALISSKEIAQSVEDYDIGSSALLIKRMVNKLVVAFGEERKREHDPCVILINQTRFKPGVKFGDPETMPGGEAQKFLSSLRVRLSARNIIEKATNMITFKETKVTVKKSKVPVRSTSFSFNLCVQPQDELKIGDTHSFTMVKSHLQALGLLMKHKDGWAVTFDAELPLVLYPTLVAMSDAYYIDPLFQAQMQALVLSHYQDQLILVDEPDYSPAEVKPGTAVEVQSDAADDGAEQPMGDTPEAEEA